MKEIEQQCPYCQKCFIPSRYCPQQRVCSRGECQRRRRSDYHRRQLASDPEYGLVCRDSRQKWRARNPGYQRRYRQTHPEYVSQNRQAQRRRDQKRRLEHLVKNNLVFRFHGRAAVDDLVPKELLYCRRTLPGGTPPDPKLTFLPGTR